jgi:hypothetical protein
MAGWQQPIEARCHMRGRRLVAITAASLALLSGCASSGEQVGGATNRAQATDSPAEALRLWNNFPAESSPRPLVLTGPTINDPSTGFTGDDKEAYISGHFTVATTLPSSSSTWKQQPLITAAQALADLRSSPPGAPSTSTYLLVTEVHLGTATFSTDRGQRPLPAWLFTFAGVRNPASVLAIAPADRWPKAPREPDHTQNLVAKIAPDGHTITITFIGAAAGTGPCDAQYKADTAQSSSAVLISIRELPGSVKQLSSSSTIAEACASIGYQRAVTIELTPALAGRVLIDSHGAPLPTG